MGTSQRKLGRPGFKNAWDYGKIAGGMAMMIPAAGGAARTAQLAYRGVRALGYGRTGVMAFFGMHGQEVGEMVESAVLPAGHPSSSPIGGLSTVEREELETLAKKYGHDITVVGSRAANKGRNVGTNLPIGKGPGTRSDIDVVLQPEADMCPGLVDALKNMGCDVRVWKYDIDGPSIHIPGR